MTVVNTQINGIFAYFCGGCKENWLSSLSHFHWRVTADNCWSLGNQEKSEIKTPKVNTKTFDIFNKLKNLVFELQCSMSIKSIETLGSNFVVSLKWLTKLEIFSRVGTESTQK